MQIKRWIEKIPGGACSSRYSWRTVPHLLAGGAGRSFLDHSPTGSLPVRCPFWRCGFVGGINQLSATGTVLRKSGTLVVTKITMASVVAAIASRIIPEHGVEVGFFAGLSTLALVAAMDMTNSNFFHHAAVRHKRRSWGICVDVVGVRAAHDDDYSGHCRDCLV